MLAPDATLLEVLRARAQRASPTRIGTDVVAGLLLAAVTYWFRPPAWLLVSSTGACLASYGVWAWADRRLLAQGWPFERRVEARWRAIRGVAAVIGIGALCLGLVAGLGIALGRLIS